MARVDLFRGHRGIVLFYNLDAAVGRGAPNRRDDVLLAQYLLKVVSNSKGLISIIVEPDGVWDDDWHSWLGYYEEHFKKADIPTWQDRRIDPVPVNNHSGTGPIHHTQYKILTLNVSYADRRPNDYPKLAEAADCPAALREILRVRWVS